MANQTLLVTMGDPSGIGIEITLKAWIARKDLTLPDFVLVGKIDRVRSTIELLGLQIPVKTLKSPTEQIDPQCLNCIDVENTHSEADETIRAITLATDFCLQGNARAMITNPIQKKRLYEAGFKHPGHTEFLAELTKAPGKSVMMLACPGLRVVPATIHIPIAEVPAKLTAELLRNVIMTTYEDLKNRFGIDQPRIVVAGLNPHAGEQGSIGSEEVQMMTPLLEELKEDGIDVRGPFPADSLFHASARQKYDAAICMYHDQALIPIKTIDFDRGVNITLGLPIIRTSPDHGTADDIYGKGIANPASLIEAIKMADEMSRTQGSRI